MYVDVHIYRYDWTEASTRLPYKGRTACASITYSQVHITTFIHGVYIDVRALAMYVCMYLLLCVHVVCMYV